MNLANQIRNTITLLENINSPILLSTQELDSLLEEFDVLEANKWAKARAARNDPEAKQARLSRHSTLAPILNNQPGGRSLLRWLHKELNLGAQADWGVGRAQRYSQEKGAARPMVGDYGSGIWGNKVNDARVLWEIIKSHPDNFIVFVGEHGVGGLRPKKGYIEGQIKLYAERGKEYNPSKDGNLQYNYAFFDRDGDMQQIDPNVFGGKGVEVSPGKYSTRGGLPFGHDPNPNLLEVVKGVIGRIKSAYAAYPAAGEETGHSVEREKIAQRSARSERLPIDQQEQLTFKTVSPIIKRVVTKILPQAGEQSKLGQARKQNQLAQVLKQSFIDSLRNQAKAAGIDLEDAAAYREFLIKASKSSVELKNTLNDFQTGLIGQ